MNTNVLLISLCFLINFTLTLHKKGEINDVWETRLGSCKMLNQPQVRVNRGSREGNDKGICSGCLSCSENIDAQKPGEFKLKSLVTTLPNIERNYWNSEACIPSNFPMTKVMVHLSDGTTNLNATRVPGHSVPSSPILSLS